MVIIQKCTKMKYSRESRNKYRKVEPYLYNLDTVKLKCKCPFQLSCRWHEQKHQMSSAAVKPKAQRQVLIVSRLDSFHFSHMYWSTFIGTHQQILIMEIILPSCKRQHWMRIRREVEQEVVKKLKCRSNGVIHQGGIVSKITSQTDEWDQNLLTFKT